MKIYTILILVIGLTSCRILQKDKQTLKKLNQKERLQLIEQRNNLSQKNHLVLIDSSHNDFTMMLWPKGKFTFSIANGFEGEAEKILIKGKHTSQKVLNLKQEIKQDSSTFKANYTKDKESFTTIKKNKLSIGYNWGWVLVLLLIFALIWVYRKVKY